MHLEHVNMTVWNLEESIAFYCTLFDGVVSWRGTAENMSKTVPAAHVRIGKDYVSMFKRELVNVPCTIMAPRPEPHRLRR